MENLSTSNSESFVSRRKWVVTIALTAALVLSAEVISRPFLEADSRWVDHLNEQPVDDGLFLFGNSMFHTGIDVPKLADQTGQEAIFDYHNGHYTNLWYLIATKAVPQFEADPDLVVWGFRPYYAMDPAFRQNWENDTDLFEPGDQAYQALSIATEADDRPGVVRWLPETLASRSELYGSREVAQEQLAATSVSAGISTLSTVRSEATADFRERFAAGEVTVIDEILRIATDGEVQLAEEQVVDGVGDFVRGPKVDFAGSFIPLTADALQDSDVSQLVVIWKPVTATNGSDITDQEEFVSATVSYLEAQGIPYLDLFHDPRITAEHFASGDHYNGEGRELITTILAEAITALP